MEISCANQSTDEQMLTLGRLLTRLNDIGNRMRAGAAPRAGTKDTIVPRVIDILVRVCAQRLW